MSPRSFCIGIAFLFLSVRPAVAQTDPAVRWPFQLPVTGVAPDSLFRDPMIDRNPVVLGLSQIMEGTLSPDQYVVGPGDAFLVTIWGKRTEHFPTTITPEGKLLIPQVSEISVAGLTIAELRARLAEEIDKYFFDVRVEATLTRLRQFQVYVLGEVNRPGVYPARAVDRVSQLITRAGGLLPKASARAVQIRRKGEAVEAADLLRFVQEGDLTLDPYVRDGDVVFVAHRTSTVRISGAVWVPGEYEWLEGDTLGTLIRLARGLKPEAYRSRIELQRFNPDHRTTSRRFLDLSDTTKADRRMPLRPDDRVFVRALPKWHERRSVVVRGEVEYPGRYVITPDSTWLTDVIDRAGGFTEEASLFEAMVIRQDTTVTADPEFERLKKVPVGDMTPTEYAYFKMKARSRPGVMVVDFKRLFNDHDRSEDIRLKGGDQVAVARNRETVTVTGQVASPGAVVYDPSFGVEDYITKAGGYGWNARKGKTRVIKAKTGEWLSANKTESLGPGDTIWVPEKPYRNWGRILLQSLTLTTQMATVVLLFRTAF